MPRQLKPRTVVPIAQAVSASNGIVHPQPPNTCFALSEIEDQDIKDGGRDQAHEDGGLPNELNTDHRTYPQSCSSCFDEALAASHNFDGHSFWRNAESARLHFLTVSYRLYFELRTGGDEAIKRAISSLPLELRRRAPCRKKLELLAVTITGKPTNINEQKICSKLANSLVAAGASNIGLNDFAGWSEQNDLRTCARLAREIRVKERRPHSAATDTKNTNDVETLGKIEIRVRVEGHETPLTIVWSDSLPVEQLNLVTKSLSASTQCRSSLSEALFSLAVAMERSSNLISKV